MNTSNYDRVLRAAAALDAYAEADGRPGIPDECDLRDLLTDLFHWADFRNICLDDEIEAARDHHSAECLSE